MPEILYPPFSGTPPVPATTPYTTDVALVAGNLVALVAPTGNTVLATATTALGRDEVIGVSSAVYAPTATALIFTVHGRPYPVLFGAAPPAASNGLPVWLDTVAGQATLTRPTAGGVSVVFVGILQGADGITTTPDVLFAPRLLGSGDFDVFTLLTGAAAAYTVLASDVNVLAERLAGGQLVIALPAATGSGRKLTFWRGDLDTQGVLIDPNLAETINGNPNAPLNATGSVTIMDYRAGAWAVIG